MSTYWLPDHVKAVLSKMSYQRWMSAYDLDTSVKVLDRLVSTGFAEARRAPKTLNPKKDNFYKRI